MKALDLFCGAGGAAMGLHRAGFTVTGIDIKPQPRYPFTPLPRQRADICVNAWHGKADSHPDLLTPVLAWFRGELAQPWIVENVVGARRIMGDHVKLHGGQFGLRVHRPRLFATNFLVLAPNAGQVHDPIGVYSRRPDGRRLFTRKNVNGKVSIQRAAHSAAEACEAMGIDHAMDWDGAREAIPPAYSEHIGRYAMMALQGSA